MADDAELQAKIAAIAGKINEHKQHQQHPQTPFTPSPQGYQKRSNTTNARYSRWSPYSRVGRAAYSKPHLNRTLVLAGGQTSPPQASGKTSRDPTTTIEPADAFVSARAPGRQQLMNKDTFQREQNRLLEYQQNARKAKRQKIDHKERSTLMQHVSVSSSSDHREVVVEGIRFQLRDDGSKLIRIPDASTNYRPTPKKVSIVNVDFCRTKNGNLVRSNAIRDLLKTKTPPPCEQFTKHGTQLLFRVASRPATTHRRAGTCPFGASCKFAHDPHKVAMCKTFLHSGSCSAGEACDLSHEPTYHRVPACTHFLRGNCTNDTCLYPHIHVAESAPVCRTFSTFFHCPLGEECPKRHLFVCADYVNHGKCATAHCSLPHPDRASALRKAAARRAKTGSEEESDLSSDDDNEDDAAGIDDVDSDAAEEFMATADEREHSLSQQQDFVAFS